MPSAANTEALAAARRASTDENEQFWPSWLLVAMLTAIVTSASCYQSVVWYHEFRSGWPWDLAYYNQWFWALCFGDGQVTVRPLSMFAEEGPSVWKMNYLAPFRFAVVPIYRLVPDPKTLIVVQNIVFWWVIPAAYSLVRFESGSRWLAVSAAALVPMTPLLWPLCWNDFRELQLAIPFVLWAIQGIRSRSKALAVLGISGMLACRQEFAVMAATFAFLPPRDPESLSVRLRWRHLTFLVGASWFLFGYLGYLRFIAGPNAPRFFLQQFLIPRAPVAGVIMTSCDTLAGLGAWAVLACLAPRVAILAIPWIWGTCSANWSMELLATESWHHVRYVLPMTSLILVAGLIGYARLGTAILRWRRGRTWLALLWMAIAMAGATAAVGIHHRMARIPIPIDADEAGEVWRWIRQVEPRDGVLADSVIVAPLSSRRRLYGYVMKWNLPHPYPRLDSEIRWLFVRNDYSDLNILLKQGFDVVFRGKKLTIAHR